MPPLGRSGMRSVPRGQLLLARRPHRSWPLQPGSARPYTIALTRNVAEEQRRPIGPARETRRKRPDTPAACARSGPGVHGAPDRSRRCDVVCRTQKELAEVERKTPPVSLGVPLGRPLRSGGQAPEADALSAELQAREATGYPGKSRSGSRRSRFEAVPVKESAETDTSAARQGHLSRRLHRLP
jgi:hypothetical protein